MADTNIKISIDLASKAAEKALSDFISKGDSAEKNLKKLKDSGDNTFKEISVGIGKTTGIYEIFAGNLAANVVVKGFEAIVGAASAMFDLFVKDGVKAAQEQEVAINALNIALAQTGIYSAETSKDIQEFTAELQATTGVADNVILKNTAIIQSLAQLDKDGLKAATKAALDLSAALDKDLGTASEALGKAANGNITALQKMGIVIEKGRNNAETFENALRAVEDRFSGAAESKVNTFAGAVQLATVTFEDLTKEIGNFIVKNPVVIAVIKELGVIFTELSDSLKTETGMMNMAGRSLIDFLYIAAIGTTILDTFARTVQVLYGTLQYLVTPVVGLIGVFKTFTQSLDEGASYINKFSNSTYKNLHAVGAAGDGFLAKTTEGLLRLENAADRGLNALQNGADKASAALENNKNKTKELTEEQKKAQERLKGFTEDLIKQSENAKTQADAQIQIAKDRADREIAVEQYLLDTKQINHVEFQTAKADIEAQFAEAQAQAEQQRHQADQDRLQASLDQKLSSENQFLIARDQLEANYLVQQDKRNAESVKQQLAAKAAQVKAEKDLNDKRISATADMFGNFASLMHTNSKELFEIGKASAIAQATINTYQAITKTWAEFGYPLGIPFAIAQGIAGFVQVANIASTSPSFEDGGIVPGNSFSGDKISANVNSGEMILNRSQQASLFNMANNGGDGNGELRMLLQQTNSLLGALLEKDTAVYVGGKEITHVLRDELSMGRTFA